MSVILPEKFIYIPHPNFERNFLMLKPDAAQRNLTKIIEQRIYEKGYKITKMQMGWLTSSIIQELYGHVSHLTFFSTMLEFLLSGPVYPMIIQGENVITDVIEIVGPIKANNVVPGTLRDLRLPASEGGKDWENLLHASTSRYEAKHESELVFNGIVKKRVLIS